MSKGIGQMAKKTVISDKCNEESLIIAPAFCPESISRPPMGKGEPRQRI